MKVDFKLYKTFDADLLALDGLGISIPGLMNKALMYYVRGKLVRYHIPECKGYDVNGKRRFKHFMFVTNDYDSIYFLKNEIKYRQRTAFLKTLVRGSIFTPQIGVYFKNSNVIQRETKRIKNIQVENIDCFSELVFKGDGFESFYNENTSQNNMNANLIDAINSNEVDKEKEIEKEVVKGPVDSQQLVSTDTSTNVNEESIFLQFENMRS